MTEPALGLALRKAVLREHGFDAVVMDMGVALYRRAGPKLRERMREENGYILFDADMAREVVRDRPGVIDDLVGDIVALDAQVIGFTSSIGTSDFTADLCRRIKRENPRLALILGGPEASRWRRFSPAGGFGRESSAWEDGLDSIDAIVPGAEEFPWVELMTHHDARGGLRP